MSAASTTPAKSAVIGWVLYDVANTLFSMGVVTISFPLLVRSIFGAEKADVVVGTITAISMAIIFVCSPLLGAMTDRAPQRMPFLIGATLLCVLATAVLATMGFTLAAVCFVIANIAFQAGVQFYDALLPAVSTPQTRGRISGLGVGCGYLGSFLAIGLSVVLGQNPTWLFLAVAAGFLLLALPCFIFVREPRNTAARPFNPYMVIESTKQTIHTLRDTQAYPGLLRFLVARMFYTDAINTIILIMLLFATNVGEAHGMARDRAEANGKYVMAAALVFAIAGGLGAGRLADTLNPKRTLLGVLILWLVILAFAVAIGLFTLPFWTLYILGALTGAALGGTWASDRAMMLRLTPPARIGEFYGLYGMVGRFAAIVGPAVWAGINHIAGDAGVAPLRSQAFALCALLVLLGTGLFIFRKVPATSPVGHQ